MRTSEEIERLLANLPDSPCGLLDLKSHEDSDNAVYWKVIKGEMRSKLLLSKPACEIYFTELAPYTEVGWHDHGEESIEILVCLKGWFRIIFEDGFQIVLNQNEKIEIERCENHMVIVGEKPCQLVAMTVPREIKRGV